MWAMSLAGTLTETEMMAGGDVFHHWQFTHEKHLARILQFNTVLSSHC